MELYHFFKYRKIDQRFLNSLEEGTIYFAPPKKLNDPFDCRVHIRNALANALKLSDDEESKKLRKLIDEDYLIDTLQNDIDSLGICSFSLNLMQVEMWTHYADNHKGACVLYEFPEEFLVDPGNEIFGVSNVCYEKDSVTKWFSDIIKKLPIDFDEFIMELAKRLVTAKSPCWIYEKEVRIIRKSRGSFKIPKSFIKQICFGLQTPEADVLRVQGITKNYESNVSYCQIRKDNSDFGIEIFDM
jgi:hypothetical protein